MEAAEIQLQLTGVLRKTVCFVFGALQNNTHTPAAGSDFGTKTSQNMLTLLHSVISACT